MTPDQHAQRLDVFRAVVDRYHGQRVAPASALVRPAGAIRQSIEAILDDSTDEGERRDAAHLLADLSAFVDDAMAADVLACDESPWQDRRHVPPAEREAWDRCYIASRDLGDVRIAALAPDAAYLRLLVPASWARDGYLVDAYTPIGMQRERTDAVLAKEASERVRYTPMFEQDLIVSIAIVLVVIVETIVLALVAGWLAQDLIVAGHVLLLGVAVNVLTYLGSLVAWTYLPPGRIAHAGDSVQFVAMFLVPIGVAIAVVAGVGG